jgi:hypothetical protein
MAIAFGWTPFRRPLGIWHNKLHPMTITNWHDRAQYDLYTYSLMIGGARWQWHKNGSDPVRTSVPTR